MKTFILTLCCFIASLQACGQVWKDYNAPVEGKPDSGKTLKLTIDSINACRYAGSILFVAYNIENLTGDTCFILKRALDISFCPLVFSTIDTNCLCQVIFQGVPQNKIKSITPKGIIDKSPAIFFFRDTNKIRECMPLCTENKHIEQRYFQDEMHYVLLPHETIRLYVNQFTEPDELEHIRDLDDKELDALKVQLQISVFYSINSVSQIYTSMPTFKESEKLRTVFLEILKKGWY